MMIEKWKPIAGYEGLYDVSDCGSVRSNRTSRTLKAGLSVGRYMGVTLFRNKIGTTHYVHRLVAAAFLPHDPIRTSVNHKNGNGCDNRVGNLEYATQKENVRHSIYVLGKNQFGENGPGAKLTAADVIQIRGLVAKGVNGCAIATTFGVNQSTISRIANYKRWSKKETTSASAI